MQNEPALSIAARVTLRLRDQGPATVNNLAQTLQVSRTSIENVLGTVTNTGTVIHKRASGAGVGRPSRSYEFNAEQGVVAGVDVGNSSIRVVIANTRGVVLADHIGAGVGGLPDGVSKLAAVVREVRTCLTQASIPNEKVRAVGLSLPGIVNEAGLVVTSVVIPEWSGVDIGSLLREALGVEVSVDNGVRLAAMAEHHLGAAQLINDVLYLSVGNRVAMGLILNGQPRRGTHNAAGDIGRLLFPGIQPGTGHISWASGENAAEVFSLARDGDAAARAELDEFVDRLARALSTLIMAVDPAKVVIGGGLTKAHEDFLNPLRANVTKRLQLPLVLPIVEARLGDEAAAHGALVLAFQKKSLGIYGVEGMTVPHITPL